MNWSRFFLVNLAALSGLAFGVLPSQAQDLGDAVSQPGSSHAMAFEMPQDLQRPGKA